MATPTTHDIFGQKAATFGGAFGADDALLTFSQIRDAYTSQLIGGEVPLLLQNMALQYQQTITRLYDLASTLVFYVRGRAAGQCSLGQVVGPSKLSYAFLSSYGQVCDAGQHNLNITLLSGCGQASGGTSFNPTGAWQNTQGYIAEMAVIESIGLQMTAESMVIQQNLVMMISSLKYDESGPQSGGARGTSTPGAVGTQLGTAVGTTAFGPLGGLIGGALGGAIGGALG